MNASEGVKVLIRNREVDRNNPLISTNTCMHRDKDVSVKASPTAREVQRSVIDLFEKRDHSGQIREAELCHKLNFYILLLIVESLKAGVCFC